MEAFIGFIMTAVALFLVGYPLFQKDIQKKQVKLKKEKANRYDEQKAIVMSSIGEIEFDYKMNKLTTDDYQELKSIYKERAVELLKKRDESSGLKGDALVNKLEKEIEEDIKRIEETDANE